MRMYFRPAPGTPCIFIGFANENVCLRNTHEFDIFRTNKIVSLPSCKIRRNVLY